MMDDRLQNISSVNYWDGNSFDNGLPRDLYCDRIRPYIGNRVIKVLTGQRRVGKSFVMRQVIAELLEKNLASPQQILYVNKELYRFRFLHDADDLMSLYECFCKEINPDKKSWVFLDEVQNIPGWEEVVDSLSQDPSIDCEVFITGSNSKLLSGEMATLLSARYVEFEIQPFSFQEFIQSGLTANEGRQAMVDYLMSGGLPEFLNLRGEETRRHYVESVKDTILLKDIVERYNIKDAVLLDRICAYLINNPASLVSIQNIVNYLNYEQQRKSSTAKSQGYDTVANYIKYVMDTFMIHKVERYDIKGKEILKGSAKYYSNDNCFHNYLYAGYGYGQGALLENYVFQVVHRAGYKVYVGKGMNNEVDFVAMKKDEVIYIQVSWTLEDDSTLEREYSALEKIKDNYPKIIVTMDDIARKNRNGIRNISAWKLEEYLIEKNVY